MSFDRLFVREHLFGTLVAIKIPNALPSSTDIERLHPEERPPLERYKRTRRGTWVGGRLALAEACLELGYARSPIVNDDRGAPIVPDGVIGSLTHKDDLAIALATKSSKPYRLGVDLELIGPKEDGVAKMILSERELSEYEGLERIQKESYLMVRFSLKEAIYKALDPFVRRYVGFQEVEIDQDSNGVFRPSFQLKNSEGPFVVELHSELLQLDEDSDQKFVLSAARIKRG